MYPVDCNSSKKIFFSTLVELLLKPKEFSSSSIKFRERREERGEEPWYIGLMKQHFLVIYR